jgi:hypothetical protein
MRLRWRTNGDRQQSEKDQDKEAPPQAPGGWTMRTDLAHPFLLT